MYIYAFPPPHNHYQVHKQLGWRKPSVGMAARAQIFHVYIGM